MGETVIREIKPEDNAQVAQVIRKVFEDMGVPKVGTAYEDKALDDMYAHYNKPKATYFVVEHKGRIIGCAGVAQLDNYDGNVCELQKMYFLEEARGKGLGAKVIEACLNKAKEFGFTLACRLNIRAIVSARCAFSMMRRELMRATPI